VLEPLVELRVEVAAANEEPEEAERFWDDAVALAKPSRRQLRRAGLVQ